MSGLLKKLAEASKLTPKEKATKAFAGAIPGAVVGVPSAALNYALLLTYPFMRKFTMTPDPALPTGTKEEVFNLLDQLNTARKVPAKDIKVDFNVRPGSAAYVREKIKGGGHLDALRLNLGVSPPIIAHEMGHMEVPTALERALREVNFHIQRPMAKWAPAALALSGALSSDTEDLPIQTKAAPYVGGAMFAATLGEEIRANIRGAQLLKAIGHELPLATKLKMYLPTMTYLGKIGPLVAAPYAMSKGLEAFNRAKREGRDFTIKELFYRSPQQLAELPSSEEFKQKWKKELKHLANK